MLCRCRPLSAAEAADGESSAVVLPSHGGISVSSDPISAYNSAPLDFKFDATFGATASTRQVYEELSPAVASVLQVCHHHPALTPHAAPQHTLHRN